ncbi:centrosomal protein of 112 kDa-like isoform X2 [Saccostrea echinata]|uniref:centrosomal protein of 112 kDa-like isoform X2 n=1 Tax=Saccostrea echinata TaxID=191078 RepID=UPI002A7F6C60|nr:centrosomal protein of 112 kDa-like isoform X2 [Saccostrea echinata]
MTSSSEDPIFVGLDQKFDKVLADMKPHVLKLPHKTDRQKCAIWIKKLCEPVTGITGRKNRNAYAQLMLHMLKRGVLEGPFTSKPQEGPLPTLPPYMSIYFDEPSDKGSDDEKVPDWVAGELTSSVGSSLFRSNIGNPAASSTWKSGLSPIRYESSPRRRPHTSLGFDLDKAPGLSSPTRGLEQPEFAGHTYDDSYIDFRKPTIKTAHFLIDDKPNIDLLDGDKKKTALFNMKGTDEELSQPSPPYTKTTSNLFGSTGASSTFFPDQSRDLEKDNIQMRTKMLEARFHEEKLRLQQKHDSAVQKILDRKNVEIEDLKTNYRTKAKDLEETISKLERKIQNIGKDSQQVIETKDKQITELKRMLEESTEVRNNQFEKKMNDMIADFEQEKFEMQKQHTKNIQDILDDTNARLQKMEKEYGQQTASTASIIKDLEARVHQLMTEADKNTKAKHALEKAKMESDNKLERFTQDLQDLRERYSNLEKEHHRTVETNEQEMRTLKNKMEASLEFMKQEHNLAAAKASDSISELEQSLDQYKRSLKDAEEQRQRQMRELEQNHQQDKLHLENLHDKQVRGLKNEMEHTDQENQKKIKKLEETIREKDDEIKRLQEVNKNQLMQSEKSLEEFKLQVEKNQTRMYDEMKQQMERVETDLNKSKQAREKQSREFSKQIDEERNQHERKIVELKMALEHEKAQMLKDFHTQKEIVILEHEKEIDSLKETHQNELYELKCRVQEKQDKDVKKMSQYERQIQELREEVVQANQLRKQQLVELGLLREEEKQKMLREHESEVIKLRSEMEQQRLDLQKTHSTELEKMLEKTNARLKDIEREYNERGQKATETIGELQANINHLRDEVKRVRDVGEKKCQDISQRYEDEKKSIKKQYNSNMESLQREIDSQQARNRQLERRLEQMEADHEEKITHLKLSFEEKLRGLIPSSVRQELEDTITSLKSQINSLQQKTLILQEEVDLKSKYPLGQFSSSSPIKAV